MKVPNQTPNHQTNNRVAIRGAGWKSTLTVLLEIGIATEEEEDTAEGKRETEATLDREGSMGSKAHGNITTATQTVHQGGEAIAVPSIRTVILLPVEVEVFPERDRTMRTVPATDRMVPAMDRMVPAMDSRMGICLRKRTDGERL